jgi:hypothetical protein
MRRRQSNNQDGAINLDSLMDALTNVVAVLILVLILLQVDVSNTVERILGELKPATPEDIQQASSQLADLRASIATQQALLTAPPPTAAFIAAIEADIAHLEKSIKDNQALAIDLKKLTELAAKTRSEADAEKKKSDTLQLEIARLEALLDQTPVPAAKPATVVSIPNSRAVPENANIYYCYIRGEQAHFVNPIEAKKMFMDAFERQRDLVRERKGSKAIYDHQKTIDWFAKQNLTVRKQKFELNTGKSWNAMFLRINFTPGDGDASLADMQQADGRFHRICNLVTSYPNRVLIFRIDPAGFATYLKAREIADSYRIPCGWELDTNNYHSERLPFEVNRLEQPAPANPNAPPQPPRPARQLD